LSLTPWSLDAHAERRAVAEITYAYDVTGRPSAAVARRFLLLFVELQLYLKARGLIDLFATSKTALALGRRRKAHGTGIQHV
jgi:hypothetical protein